MISLGSALLTFSILKGVYTNFDCLSKNVYYEARNQTYSGQLAVSHVVFNRVNDNRWPNTICSVIEERDAFSWFWDGKSDNPKESSAWRKSKVAAIQALIERLIFSLDRTKGATHYHRNDICPVWANKMEFVIKIEDHIFYMEESWHQRKTYQNCKT